MKKAKRMMILLSLLLPFINFIFSQPALETELSSITVQKTDDQIEVMIEYKGDIPYDSFSLMNPNRLVLDFLNVQTVLTPPLTEINQLGITSIRSAMNRPGVARIVFNFTEEIPQYEFEETERGLKVLFWKPSKKEQKEEHKEEVKEVVEQPVKKEVEKKPEVKKIVEPPKPAELIEEKKMALGLSSGYVAFQDKNFETAYGKGGFFLESEYSLYLPFNVKYIDIWTSFTYFEKSGKMSITEEDLKLRITNLSLALRYLRQMSRFKPFIGAGIDYIVYKEILPKDFVVSSVGGSDLGFHLQGGTYFKLIPDLALKIHIKYRWSKTTENEVDVNLGGIKYGIGLIFLFNL